MKFVTVFFGLFVLSSGCTSMSRLDKNATLKSNDESIFVLGVAPDNYRIIVFPGSLNKDGKFHQNPFRPAAVFGAAEGGYVVGKASAGDILAITAVKVAKDKDSISGGEFIPCGDAKTMVFDVPGGKVLYIGNIEYAFDADKLKIGTYQNIDSARRYFDSQYPNLRGRLDSWNYELASTDISCTPGTMYIPIYLPR